MEHSIFIHKVVKKPDNPLGLFLYQPANNEELKRLRGTGTDFEMSRHEYEFMVRYKSFLEKERIEPPDFVRHCWDVSFKINAYCLYAQVLDIHFLSLKVSEFKKYTEKFGGCLVHTQEQFDYFLKHILSNAIETPIREYTELPENHFLWLN